MTDKLIRTVTVNGRRLGILVDKNCPQCQGTGIVIVPGDPCQLPDGRVQKSAVPSICVCLQPAPIMDAQPAPAEPTPT